MHGNAEGMPAFSEVVVMLCTRLLSNCTPVPNL